ncbi:hypothetical protein Q8A67_002609 [Cirrhinus molitorella]|uniref:UBX domain-containing protein n=1 Tax=Cirrhinus molitorella TaxID=172907 RepID=A0AA88QI24_9TELE|nr:hypothetical protein Q8A67_002609 [Cirrhinus molitorella]
MSSEHEPQTAIFDRVFNSNSRARRELSNNNQDNLLSSTRRLFRRQVQRLHRPPGRQENAVWYTHLVLLPGPDIEVLPSTSELDRFGSLGLGRPVQESSGTGTQKSNIQLNWTLSELNNFVCQCYPNVSLNLIGFHMARAGKGRKIHKVHVDSVRDLKKAIGKSRLYIVPRAEVLQYFCTLLYITKKPSPSISQNPVQTSSTAATLNDNSLDAESMEAVNLDTLQEWRAIRSQQDEEYSASLLVDQEKVILKKNHCSQRQRQCYDLLEERRKNAIKERQQRMAARVEPLEGEFLKIKYPDGYVNKRKFIMSEPIQILFDFIGQNEMASEVFQVQEATASKAIESTSAGSIADHGIMSSSTLYVLWKSSLDDLVMASSPALPPVASSPALPPVASSPALPPVASSPALPPTFAEPSLASPSAIPLVALPPVQHPLALSPAQSSVTLSSAQLPYVMFEDQPLLSRPSAQPNIIDLVMHPPFSPPSPQGSVIDLLEDAPSSFHQEPPLHWEAPLDEYVPVRNYTLQTRLYSFVGKMIAVCIVHGGVGPHFFSERLFQQICGLPTSPASVDEVGDHTFREQLIKIQETSTVPEKDSFVQSALEFFTHGRLQAALDQFVEGLQTLGLLEEMRKNSALFYDMFVNEEKPLQAKDLCSLFKVNFSPQGSNRRARENKTICHWRDWLIDVEVSSSSFTLHGFQLIAVLVFALWKKEKEGERKGSKADEVHPCLSGIFCEFSDLLGTGYPEDLWKIIKMETFFLIDG